MAERPLTDKQKRFVEEYLVDLNATAAAGRAGYKGKYLDRIGSQLLGKSRVAEAVAAAQAARSRRTELTQDEVVNGLRTEAAYAGEGASHSARVRAWELLGKHQGMFPEKHEHGGPGGGAIPFKVYLGFDPGAV